MSDSEPENETENNQTPIKTADLHHIDSEYDEELDIPDTVSVIKIADVPIQINNDKIGTVDQRIPFNVIHNPADKLKSFHHNVFIPGVDIHVQIIHNERSVTTHLLNPNLYTIQFTHGDYTWTVKKRYKHIQHLHQQLRIFRATLNIPFPTKAHREKRESFKNNIGDGSGKKKSVLPRFPSKPEALVPFERLDERKRQLEEYLKNLLRIVIYRSHEEMLKFMEVSHLSFVQDLGIKGKEGLIQKRTGSTQPGQAGCNCFGFLQSTICIRCNYYCNDIVCGKWRKRWFFIKDTCFGYIHPKEGRVKTVVLFDQGFEVSTGMYSAGMHQGIQLMTLSRQLFLKCWTRRKGKEWTQYLKDIANNEARDFTQPNPNNSYAPPRTNVKASWFVDGSSHMSAVADAIEGAQEEIYITDWWLSPEIYLKRRVLNSEYWRLDKVLLRKAQEGVKVFVLLYKEVEMALGINSFYSKQRLVEGSENIKVLRHPDHTKAGVFLWAHHEKLVIIDQSIAFVGGIDLCYGRWDDADHRLTDLGSIFDSSSNCTTLKKKTSTSPGNISYYEAKGLPIYPPLPPDIVVSTSSPEPPVRTPSPLPQLQPGDSLLITRPIPERLKCNTPEFERKFNVFDKLKDNVKIKGKEVINLFYTTNENDTPQICIAPPQTNEDTQYTIDDLDGSIKLWQGKDYTNFIVKDFSNLDAPYADLVDRRTTPRMPWHDISVVVQGPAARDAARHFIERWNAAKLEKARKNVSYPYLLPKSYNIPFQFKRFDNLQDYNVTCQMLRSVSCWSCGFLESEMFEQSIHNAYVDTINRAQHYVYIENQFFVTLSSSSNVVHNQIGDALFNRITRAHRANTVFRVYVVMPLLPGFEGEVGGATGTALHAVTHWNYASISRGKYAILNRLNEYGIEDTSQYINFYGLRTHSILNNEPITELIYVHSKLMIADDRIVICGSANINDRSMLGKRDSEVAVIIQDEEFIEGIMNGESFPCGKYAGSLRKYLFKEHLGILGRKNETFIDVSDPITESFYKDIWHRIAKDNTKFYEKVFHCIPSDKVESFSDLKQHQEEPPLYHTEFSKAEVMLNSIEGHLVLLPLNFLCNETLTPSGSSVEGMMPTYLWT